MPFGPPMLRITELRLPLDHAEDALRPAVVRRLGVADADLLAFTVFRRAYDARKKTAIVLIYTIDCEVRDEAASRPRPERSTWPPRAPASSAPSRWRSAP